MEQLSVSSLPLLSWRPGRGATIASFVFGPLAAIAFLPWWATHASLGVQITAGAFIAPMALSIFSERRVRVRQAYLDNRGIPLSDRARTGMWPHYLRMGEELRFFALFVMVFVVLPVMVLSEPDPQARGRGLLGLFIMGGLVLTFCAAWWAASPWFRVRWWLMLIEFGPRAYHESLLLRALAHDPELSEAGIKVQPVPSRRA